ncbi:MAG: sodium:solute symporter family protein, partial [Melioribacteraceae bacterium]|nr:sodium:solute symporter family protein [Melioribacteraceae bacterium]
FLLFFLGISYLGGFDVFWNLLPQEWKMPLAKFNEPSSFNFVGIFWQDGVAGSIGFLFMNMGLIMRFMATKSVDEGRKAATFNILFMLPLSAVVVGNAGWIGKALSISNPELVPPNTSPDQIFVVVANIVAIPGVFGFIMAALTAALMSTVDTLINATAAIYINDVYRPTKIFLKSKITTQKVTDKNELAAARYSSVVITALGVLSVLAFKNFPTVYEAHGYFHSTLTPPLVVAIFLGLFWRKFTPSAVIATFVSGVALMIVGLHDPNVITPFNHGIEMNASHPYSYIRALYNLLVCVVVAVIVTLATNKLNQIVISLKANPNGKTSVYSLLGASVIIFLIVLFNLVPMAIQFLGIAILMFSTAIVSTYFIDYDPEAQIDGLTVWSVEKAKELFKGSKVNEEEGEIVSVNWKLKDGEDEIVNFSKNDMERMKANVGDLVYLCDARKYLGGLKSVHVIYGEPHDEDGIVYINNEAVLNGVFEKNRKLTAEKEM